MLVSIVIPTYNRVQLTERAVYSALSQTYADLEIIIVDDASTDATRDRIETLRNADRRIRYLCHNNNRGAQAARNTGIQAAGGQCVAFLDSDNEWLPQKLQRQMALFSEKVDAPGVVYCGYSKVSASGDLVNEYVPRHRGYVYKQTLTDWLADTSTIVVRKDILENVHGFDNKVRAYQEWDLCIRLARECSFDFVPDSLAIYHEHDLPSISKDQLKDAYGYLGIVDLYRNEMLAECGRSTLSNHYLQTGRLFVLAGRFDLARAYFLRSILYYPLAFKAIANFGASLLGKDVYGFLRSNMHRWG
ncbi:MAG: glycosyltransferase family 2 protein [Acidobacteria bacterium]|nr:glycosyltransferase family 2 protein [Acidobacteriota bacterium]